MSTVIDDLKSFWEDSLPYEEEKRVVPVVEPRLLEVGLSGQKQPFKPGSPKPDALEALRGRAVQFGSMANIQRAEGDLSAAWASYEKGLAKSAI